MNLDPINYLNNMGITDAFNYILYKNPLSATVIDKTKAVGGYYFKGSSPVPVQPPVAIPLELKNLAVSRIVMIGSPYVRIAGLSGAAAVLLGAYGAHSAVLHRPDMKERKRVFKTASLYHFMHTLALMGVPLSRHPKITFTFLSLGITLFCGTCYYDAFTGDTRFRKYTPLGGMLLVAGWIGFVI